MTLQPGFHLIGLLELTSNGTLVDVRLLVLGFDLWPLTSGLGFGWRQGCHGGTRRVTVTWRVWVSVGFSKHQHQALLWLVGEMLWCPGTFPGQKVRISNFPTCFEHNIVRRGGCPSGFAAVLLIRSINWIEPIRLNHVTSALKNSSPVCLSPPPVYFLLCDWSDLHLSVKASDWCRWFGLKILNCLIIG